MVPSRGGLLPLLVLHYALAMLAVDITCRLACRVSASGEFVSVRVRLTSPTRNTHPSPSYGTTVLAYAATGRMSIVSRWHRIDLAPGGDHQGCVAERMYTQKTPIFGPFFP